MAANESEGVMEYPTDEELREKTALDVAILKNQEERKRMSIHDLIGKVQDLEQKIAVLKINSSTIDRHTRAMCAHVEAMGIASQHYTFRCPDLFKKWGLVDDKGMPVK